MLTTSSMPLDSVMEWNEGRSSETCRRLTFLMLFDAQGRPQGWLWLLGAVFAMVVALALGFSA